MMMAPSYICLLLHLWPLVSLVKSVGSEVGSSVQEEAWDYEPRFWVPEGEAESCGKDAMDCEFAQDKSDTEQGNMPNLVAGPPKKMRSLSITGALRQQKCTQFRSDIRETVTCDSKNCDKFNFELPKERDKLTLVQTTKHGMRFHQVDLSFQPEYTPRELVNSSSDHSRIKFDLFELFKPKPTSSPRTTLSPVTDLPGQNSTSADENISSQDRNATRLVTTFRLDTKRKRQRILGFGGALSDSTCRNIKSLSPNVAKSLMEDYFGANGLRYSIARLTMGSSDFSLTPYTNNDGKPGSLLARADGDDYNDLEMKNFRLVPEDLNFKIPIARQAIAMSQNNLKLFSSLWSPPVWMKNNSHIVHGYLKGDVFGPYYKSLADLIIKWLEAYRREGISFWATTALNEPFTGIKPFIFHNSLGITLEDYVTFLKLYMGPMLKQRGFNDTKLLILDDNKGYVHRVVRAILNDQHAAQYVSGVGIHWYMNDEYENLNMLPREFPEKFFLSTEASNGYMPFQVHTLPGNWDRGVAYMYDISKVLQKGAAGWVDWNMALDLKGGPSWANNNLDAAVIVNAKYDEYYKSPAFYAIGHFSRLLGQETSWRLDHRIANARYDYPLEAVGFLTGDEHIVITVLNTNKHVIPFKIIVDRHVIRTVNLRPDSFNTIAFKWRTAYS